MNKLRLAELTATEAREALAENPVILLPMGSHEDQGPHAPMGDYLLTDAIASIEGPRSHNREHASPFLRKIAAPPSVPVRFYKFWQGARLSDCLDFLRSSQNVVN